MIKYGCQFPDGTSELEIELSAIRHTDSWHKERGRSLFYHHQKLQQLLWPKKRWHEWNELLVPKFCEHDYVAVLGPASSGKSHEAVCYALCCYFARPDETAVLVSSTTRDALELRAWGEIKKYWGLAKELHEELPGAVVGSKQRIATDDSDVEDRDFRKGISCVACKIGTTWVGLGPFVGIKQKYVMLLADEASLMSPAFMDAVSNLSKNENFKLIAMGNPKDRTDPLGILAEPRDEDGGWDGLEEKLETRFWPNRYPNGISIQLCGLDSPNMKAPANLRPPYPFLIKRSTIESDVALYGEDSIKVTMMDYGVMPKASASKRVITRSLCIKHHAFEDPIWMDLNLTRIFGLDAAYGGVGGDRCVGCELAFGKDSTGRNIIAYIGSPIIVPVSVRRREEPCDQIAMFVKSECLRRGIPPENVFYDSTGKGELGMAFARLSTDDWKSSRVIPVEFGGQSTERQAGPDTRKTCQDEFIGFISELWWATRWIIESSQLRSLPESVFLEGAMKSWDTRPQGLKVKTKVESKDETKERLGRSPDLYDAFVVAVEGARQRGFQIDKLDLTARKSAKPDWLQLQSTNYEKMMKDRLVLNVVGQ